MNSETKKYKELYDFASDTLNTALADIRSEAIMGMTINDDEKSRKHFESILTICDASIGAHTQFNCFNGDPFNCKECEADGYEVVKYPCVINGVLHN